jgi:muramidase (phage lysozyme)
VTRREIAFAALLSLGVLLGAKGCDSNYIGVQDYGTIVGNVVDQTGKPIPNAFVRTTGSTATSTTDPKGGFLLQHVAVGEQTVTAYAAGYNGQVTADVIVKKDTAASAGNMQLLSSTAPQHLMDQTPAPAPVSTST